MNTAKDPLTGEVFVKTRRNQVYASRANQIKFNNQKAFERRHSEALINKHLRMNKAILEAMLKDKIESATSTEYFKGAGFHFGCITHMVRFENELWSCIYNVGYLKVSETEYKLKQFNHVS